MTINYPETEKKLSELFPDRPEEVRQMLDWLSGSKARTLPNELSAYLSQPLSSKGRIIQYVLERNGKDEHPTLQEISDALGLSKTTVHYHVHELCEAGILEMTSRKSRTLRVART